MPNMQSIISASNKQKLRGLQQVPDDPLCTCRQQPCPVDRKCTGSDLVYKAEIKNTPENYFYLGSTSCKFTQRFHPHKHSLVHRDSKNGTTLSKKIWQLRDEGHNPEVSFSIVGRAQSAQSCAPRCNLCLKEKLSIITENSPLLLNSRQEIFTRCKHRARWKVSKLIWYNVLFGGNS